MAEGTGKLFRAKMLYRTIHHLEEAICSLVHERESGYQRQLRAMLGELQHRAQGVTMDVLAQERLLTSEAEWIAEAIAEKSKRAWAEGEPE